MERIEVPNWMKEEAPVNAYVCELVNTALAHNPKMTLAEFATMLDMANKQWSYERMTEIVQKQFEGGRYEPR